MILLSVVVLFMVGLLFFAMWKTAQAKKMGNVTDLQNYKIFQSGIGIILGLGLAIFGEEIITRYFVDFGTTLFTPREVTSTLTQLWLVPVFGYILAAFSALEVLMVIIGKKSTGL